MSIPNADQASKNPMPWPSSDAPLRQRDGPDADIVVFGARLNTWDRTAKAFWGAADVLTTLSLNAGLNKDYLAIPAIYLYRHSVELRLKELRLALCERFKQPRPDLDHDLVTNWEECCKFWPLLIQIPGQSAKRVDCWIRELDKLDPGSDKFRYPERKDGAVQFPAPLPINLRHFQKTMHEVSGFLELVSQTIRLSMNQVWGRHACRDRDSRYGR